MAEYEFVVRFYNTYGSFEIEANDYDEAVTKAYDEIGNALMDLPIEVEFDVDCIREPDEDDEDEEDA